MTILDVMRDPHLFGRWFEGSSWERWRVFMRAAFALPMNEAELAIFSEHTGRSVPPAMPVRRATIIAGRRSGKTITSALLAVYFAAFINWRQRLAPGELAVVMILAADRKQARVAFRYVRAFINETPMLKAMVVSETRESMELNNGGAVEIATSSHRSVRGYTCGAVIADECAFWPTDSDSDRSDVETIAALEPTLATTGGPLLAISSPYAKRGYLWDEYRRGFGKDSADTLVWVAPSQQMNPTLSERVVTAALEADESKARAEWLAEFRADVEGFVSRETAEACVMAGVRDLPPSPWGHVAFCDPSGGSRDSFTAAIAHREGDGIVLDVAMEWKPPFSPDEVVEEIAELLKLYKLRVAVGDRYAAAWVTERFKVHGIRFEPSEKTKSQIYDEVLPLLNAGRVRLLDLPRLINQLLGLERRTAFGGRPVIDHPPNGSDDLINSACGAVLLAAKSRLIPFVQARKRPSIREMIPQLSKW